MEQFTLAFVIGDRRFVVDGESINRNTTDGAGNPVLYARADVYQIGDAFDMFIGEAVVNLTPDWRIKSVMM